MQYKVDHSQYQVFVMVTPISVPLSMFRHAYFVVNRKGQLDRWDLLHKPNLHEDSKGHVHRNTTSLWRGFSYVYLGRLFAFKAAYTTKCIGMIEGGSGSVAHQLAEHITAQSFEYSHRYGYHYWGPNCNTYVQWFLDQHKGHDIELPRMALGRFAHRL